MPELLLRSARLAATSVPTDVLIGDGVIVAIDSDLAVDGAELLDLHGRFVLPGLWDHHVHFDQWAETSRRLDLSGATSAAHAVTLVRDRLRSVPPEPGQLLVGYGFRDALWPDQPERQQLDSVSQLDSASERGASEHAAIVLISSDLHCAWMNSRALERFGLVTHATGLVKEAEAMGIFAELSDVPDDVHDGWVAEAAQAAAARGVVGIVDLEAPWSLDAWTRRVRNGLQTLRVSCGVWTPKLDEAIARGLITGDVIPDTKGLVSMGPLKIITDGSLNTRTAYCRDAYPGLQSADNPYGLSLIALEDLVGFMSKANAAGIDSAIHAIGDHANAVALRAFADSGADGSIEHAQLLESTDLARFAELGVVASVQPEHAMDDRDVADRYWAGRTGRAFMLRSLLEAGALLTLGSDAPVAPLDPWISIAAAMSHRRDGRDSWHPEQEITFEQALAASTPGPLVVGAEADLVVLDSNPWRSSAEQLRAQPVAATLLGGQFTYRAL